MLDPLKMAELLRRRVAGEPFPYNFIRKEDPYSAAPEDLVREHAPGTDPGQGKGVAWFCWPAECHESAGGRSASKRKRKVAAAGATYWHPEARRKPILGTDKKPVGAYKRALSYVKDVKNPPGMATPFRRKRLGWCMLEIGLHGADKQLVLCKLYKSPRPPTDPETSTEAGVPGGGMPSPAPAPAPLTAEIPISRVAIVRNDGPAPSNPAARSIHSPRLASRSTMKWGPLPAVAVDARHGGKKPAMWPTVVMKFGRSSLASAEEMKQVAKLLCCFNEETPVVVLSAMGETTDKLLQAGHQAMRCDAQDVCKILDLDHVKNSHLSTVHELGLQSSTISGTLDWLERHLKRIARTQDLSAKKLDYLLSFGERLSTNILSAYLNELGTKAVQYNVLDLGLVTTDKYTDIMQATYSAIAEQLEGDWIDEPAMPIIAGFLGKEWESCALTTSGRGVSDLTAITIGRALKSREIQIWKDVDGILTCDPNICSNAIPIPILTFHEAAELAYFGAQRYGLNTYAFKRYALKTYFFEWFFEEIRLEVIRFEEIRLEVIHLEEIRLEVIRFEDVPFQWFLEDI